MAQMKGFRETYFQMSQTLILCDIVDNGFIRYGKI